MNIRKLINAVVALAAAGGLLVVLPAGLWVGVGWPLPTAVPTLDEIQMGLRSGIDPQLVIKSLAVIVWVVWAQLVVALTVEMVAALRGRPPRRIRVMPGLQGAAGRLVAAFVLVAATAAPLRAASPASVPLGGFVAQPVTYSQPLDRVTTDDDGAGPSEQVRHVSYTTRRGDSLWSIAETTLGDGRRWQEIRSLNPDRTTTDGWVDPGVDLALPADANATSEDPTSRQVTVQAGDSFWSIAETALTRAWGRSPDAAEITRYWRQVIDANHDRLAPPHNPDMIYPGQVFHLPNPSDYPATEKPNTDSREVGVEEGDSLWSIARDALTVAGDRTPTDTETAEYVRHLIDHNRDPIDDPDVIHPGQTFNLPPISPDATDGVIADPEAETHGPDPAEPEPAEPSQTTPAVDPTDETSGNEADAATTTAPTSDPASPNPESPPDTAEQALPTVANAPTNTAAPSDHDSGLVDPGDDIDDIDDGSHRGLLPTAAGVAGMGILAAGLVALVERLRRVQFQHRRPGTIPTPPPDTSGPVETTLRSAEAPTATELIDVALRAIGRHAIVANTPPPLLAGVHISGDELRVLLWSPNAHPPAGWRTDDDNTTWVLPAETDLTHLHLESDGAAAPYPTLVTAGHNDDGQLLVDLEFIGALQITGKPSDVAAACYTIATELAASTFADVVEVVCVGFGHDLAQLERVRVVDHLDSTLLDQLEATARAVDESAAASLLEGRMGPGGDSLYPVVVIDPATAVPQGADRLLATAVSGRAVAAVVGYPTGDQWRFHLEDDTVRIDPLGQTLSRRNLTPHEQAEVTHLIAAAKDLNGVVTDQTTIHVATNGKDPADDIAESHAAQTTLFVEGAGSDSSIGVRVLGTVKVEGLSPRSRSRGELCAYLTLHRDGVEGDRLMEALWPNEAPDYDRLSRTVSRTRKELGPGPDGDPYIPIVTGGIYRPGPHLHCDLTRFTEHTSHADRTDDDEQVDDLGAALHLVSGPPFSGTREGYAWVWAEGLYSFSVVAIDETAHRLSGLALNQDNGDLATWSARQGLLAAPTCENCYRNLMRAAIAEDNQVALEVIFDELVAVVEADDDEPDAMSFLGPETVTLYEQHSRKHSHRRKR